MTKIKRINPFGPEVGKWKCESDVAETFRRVRREQRQSAQEQDEKIVKILRVRRMTRGDK